MGYYIEGPTLGKTDFLIKEYDAKEININEAKEAFDQGFGIIFIVNNFLFDAAGYAYNKEEFNYWYESLISGKDSRPYRIVKMDKDLAEKLSGYK